MTGSCFTHRVASISKQYATATDTQIYRRHFTKYTQYVTMAMVKESVSPRIKKKGGGGGD